MHQQAAAHAAEAAASVSASTSSQSPFLPPDQLLMHRQLTLEAQREFLLRRGAAAFSPRHPFISGQVDVHPELQGRLPFHEGGAPSRTIPLRPEDYQRFKPELWVRRGHTPGRPVSFNDPALLRTELELRRRRELQRQSHHEDNSEELADNDEEKASSFASLPWEEIVFGANPEANMTTFEELNKKKKGKSKDGNKTKGGWFSSNSHPRSSAADEGPGVVRKVSDHWLLKERKQQQQQQMNSLSQIQSMPPAVGTLRDSGIGEEGNVNTATAVNGHLSRNGTGRSSFGIVLKDKFQKNTRYLPHDGSGRRENEEEELEDNMSGSDDTLIHNMSEGSFDKEVNQHHHHHHHHLANSSTGSNSLGHSSASPHNSMEGSPRMVAKAVGGPVSMNKKTIRNYTPKDGGNNMLRVIEDNRRRREEEEETERKTSVEKMIDDFHKNLPPPSTAANTAKNTARKGHHHGHHHDNNVDTLSSRVSAWSEASFDYQPASLSRRMHAANAMPSLEEVPPLGGSSALSPRVSPEGERIPPEGADNEEHTGTNFVHRIQVTAQVNTPPKSSSQNNSNHQPSSGNGRGRSRKKDVVANNKKKDASPAVVQEQVDNGNANEDEDEFANLHKLLREGRIAGLNEKPPSFIPPTPPSAAKKSSPNKANAAAAKRRSSSKPPAPARPLTAQQRSQSQSREVGAGSPDSGGGGGRKKAAAPQPPGGSSNPKTGGGGSVEDLTRMDAPGRRAANRNTALVNGAKVRRTPSNHETKTRHEQRREESMHMAQLIADSTERKFSLNPFKGMWKKKHYSFDFNA